MKKEKKVKEEKQSDNFIIDYVIYPFDLMVSLGESDEEFINSCKKVNVNSNDDCISSFETTTSCRGRTLMTTGNQTILRLRNYPKTNEDYSCLQHEIFHCVDFLFNKIGIKLCTKSDEAYAYLIGYLTLQIYNKIRI